MRCLFSSILLILYLLVSGQERYDVVIQEIMADPSPAAGLPPVEWIEIRNRSTREVNLQGWRIMDAAGRSGPVTAFTLHADSIVVLCAASSLPLMVTYGSTLAVTSFPSLDNDGEWLAIIDGTGRVMHAVDYKPAWHVNSLKRDGGWTLEMINPGGVCMGEGNWTSCRHDAGGTPGHVNSVEDVNAGLKQPRIQRVYNIDSASIALVFNDGIDSLKASVTDRYRSATFPVTGAFPIPPLFREVHLRLQGIMQENEIYAIELNGLDDCSGGAMEPLSLRFARASMARPSSVVINEIMFNPTPLQQDYVELYNNSSQVIDLSRVSIGNRNTTGLISDLTAICDVPVLFFPGDYYVVTPDENVLRSAFPQATHSNHHSLALPSYPDDKGSVVITDHQGYNLDEVNYSEKWHFQLISNREGVALEKIDPDLPPGMASSWHSASTASGYGTPGDRNSQLVSTDTSLQELRITPGVFSPDNDGIDDQCLIRYRLPASGYVANVWIYDLHGRMIRRLVRGDLLAASGYWTWDGLDENLRHLPVAPYIICTELFNLQGRTKRYRNVAVLARRNR